MNFKTLIALEKIKIQNKQTLVSLVIFLFFTVLISVAIFGTWNLPPSGEKLHIQINTLNPFGRLVSMFAPHLALIPSLFYIMKVGAEYKHDTIRKNVIDGMNRNDIYYSQIIFLFGSYVFWMILFLIVFIFCGSIRLRENVAITEFICSIRPPQITKLLIYLFFYGSFSIFLITLTRSSSISIFILFATLFVESMLVMIFKKYGLDHIISFLPFETAVRVRIADSVSSREIFVFLTYMLSLLGMSQIAILKRDL